MMYTFDLLDQNCNAYDLQVGMFADDQEARGAAAAILARHLRAAAVDVWDVRRCIARIAAPSPRGLKAVG